VCVGNGRVAAQEQQGKNGCCVMPSKARLETNDQAATQPPTATPCPTRTPSAVRRHHQRGVALLALIGPAKHKVDVGTCLGVDD